jgi:hypothetical protein
MGSHYLALHAQGCIFLLFKRKTLLITLVLCLIHTFTGVLGKIIEDLSMYIGFMVFPLSGRFICDFTVYAGMSLICYYFMIWILQTLQYGVGVHNFTVIILECVFHTCVCVCVCVCVCARAQHIH